MRNIRILAEAVLEIFCSQGCSYTKCLCPKITQPKIYGIDSKANQFIYNLVCNYMPNIRILALAVLQIFCSQSCSYIVEKRHNSRSTRPVEEKKYVSTYFSCTCHIYNFKILAEAVLEFLSCQSITDRRTDGEAQTNMPPQLLRSWGHKKDQQNYGRCYFSCS